MKRRMLILFLALTLALTPCVPALADAVVNVPVKYIDPDGFLTEAAPTEAVCGDRFELYVKGPCRIEVEGGRTNGPSLYDGRYSAYIDVRADASAVTVRISAMPALTLEVLGEPVSVTVRDKEGGVYENGAPIEAGRYYILFPDGYAIWGPDILDTNTYLDTYGYSTRLYDSDGDGKLTVTVRRQVHLTVDAPEGVVETGNVFFDGSVLYQREVGVTLQGDYEIEATNAAKVQLQSEWFDTYAGEWTRYLEIMPNGMGDMKITVHETEPVKRIPIRVVGQVEGFINRQPYELDSQENRYIYPGGRFIVGVKAGYTFSVSGGTWYVEDMSFGHSFTCYDIMADGDAEEVVITVSKLQTATLVVENDVNVDALLVNGEGRFFLELDEEYTALFSGATVLDRGGVYQHYGLESRSNCLLRADQDEITVTIIPSGVVGGGRQVPEAADVQSLFSAISAGKRPEAITADMNGDGTVNLKDVTRLYQVAAG